MNKGENFGFVDHQYSPPTPPCDGCVLNGDCKKKFTACVSFAHYVVEEELDWFAKYNDRLTPTRAVYNRIYGRQR